MVPRSRPRRPGRTYGNLATLHVPGITFRFVHFFFFFFFMCICIFREARWHARLFYIFLINRVSQNGALDTVPSFPDLPPQKQPRLRLSTTPGSFPLLHLPLAFPPSSSRPLTAWCTITLCLPSYLPYFSSHELMQQGDPSSGDEPRARSLDVRKACSGPPLVPSGRYSHLAYIRIYATCRLRRIWFDEAGPNQKAPWEFELYGTD